MEETKKLKYKVGDFVRCAYDLYDFYAILYDEEDHPYFPFYGTIIHITSHSQDWWFFPGPVYQVYCLDGIHRFFLEDEMHLV
tara:strand:+ start:3074 stop:3319 length:246 start_codon:yes stop_codon:yes gene_type:complete